MELDLKKTTVGRGIVVWRKVLELIGGGLTLDSTGFKDGVILPSGSLLNVNENTRKAVPIKTAVASQNAGASGIYVEKGHFFVQGDYITVANKNKQISSITAKTNFDIFSVGTGFSGTGAATVPTGAVIMQAATAGAGTGEPMVAPNSILRHDVVIENNNSVVAVRRGTAYKRRIQAHNDALLATLPATIQLSDSF